MIPAYHLVGLSYCNAPRGEDADSWQYSSDPRPEIIDIWNTVLAHGEILSSKARGHSGPTPIDEMAGDNRYVFLTPRMTGPKNFECIEELAYGFVFDAEQLISLGAGVRTGDLLGLYVSVLDHLTGNVFWSDIRLVNDVLSTDGDPVEVGLEEAGFYTDDDGPEANARIAEIERVLKFFARPGKKVLRELRKTADENTLYGEQALDVAQRGSGWELLVRDRLPLVRPGYLIPEVAPLVIGAVVAGEVIPFEELMQIRDAGGIHA